MTTRAASNRAPSNRPAPRPVAANVSFPLGTRPTVNVAPAPAAPTAAPVAAAPAVSKALAGRAAAGSGASAVAPAAATTATKRISQQRYDAARCADPFASNAKRCKTTFSQSYVQGNIPCRLQSTAARYHLQWDSYAAQGFSPDLFIVCADGLSETDHPHVKLAPMMFEELLQRTAGNAEMLAGVIPAVVLHIRKAVLDDATIGAGLLALMLLAQSSGNLLLPQLPKLVPALTKPLRDKRYTDKIVAILQAFEAGCGAEATRFIKSKIPTWQ